MGYKTELQSNNADLQTILNKVNALPEAGGGGGGGSVETCTVTFQKGSGMAEPGTETGIVYFSDGSEEVKSTAYNATTGTVVTVNKNSIIFIDGAWSTNCTATNATQIWVKTGRAAYFIKDNAVLTVR